MARHKQRLLGFDTLEGRANPATITTALVGGTFTLTGDASASTIEMTRAGNDILFTGMSGTTFNKDNAPSISVPATTANIRMNLGGGVDVVYTPGAVDFTYTGNLTCNMGDGDNLLSLYTASKLELGKVTITGGDGYDNVYVQGGNGQANELSGPLTATFGNGGSSLAVGGMSGKGATVNAGAGDDTFYLSETDLKGNVKATFGAGNAVVTGVNSVLNRLDATTQGTLGTDFNFVNLRSGPLTLQGENVLTTFRANDLDTMRLLGGYNAKAAQENTLTTYGEVFIVPTNFPDNRKPVPFNMTGANIDIVVGADSLGYSSQLSAWSKANITATDSLPIRTDVGSFVAYTANITAGNDVTLEASKSSPDDDSFSFGTANVKGRNIDVRLAGEMDGFKEDGVGTGSLDFAARENLNISSTTSDGDVWVGGNLTLSGRAVNVGLTTGSLTVDGNLTVNAVNSSNFSVLASASRQIDSVTYNGGRGNDIIVVAGSPNITKNANFNLGDGDNYLLLQSVPNLYATIGGNLTVQSGNGGDYVATSMYEISGHTTINTGAGKDTVALDATLFRKSFALNTGLGDDTIKLATLTSGVSAITEFQSKTAINAGDGNDRIQIGLGTNDGGNMYSHVKFPGDAVVDGSLGMDLLNYFGDANSTMVLPKNW